MVGLAPSLTSAKRSTGASTTFSPPSSSLLNRTSISVPPGSAMDTGISSQPSYTSNVYGVISVHPTPWPPDLPSGRVYRRTPFASAGANPGTRPAIMPCTASAGAGAEQTPSASAAAAAPSPRRESVAEGTAERCSRCSRVRAFAEKMAIVSARVNECRMTWSPGSGARGGGPGGGERREGTEGGERTSSDAAQRVERAARGREGARRRTATASPANGAAMAARVLILSACVSCRTGPRGAGADQARRKTARDACACSTRVNERATATEGDGGTTVHAGVARPELSKHSR